MGYGPRSSSGFKENSFGQFTLQPPESGVAFRVAAGETFVNVLDTKNGRAKMMDVHTILQSLVSELVVRIGGWSQKN